MTMATPTPVYRACLTDIRKIQSLEGRVLGQAEDEITGRPYMLLEGTDHKVHFIYHTPAMEDARHHGKMKPNTSSSSILSLSTAKR